MSYKAQLYNLGRDNEKTQKHQTWRTPLVCGYLDSLIERVEVILD